MYFIGQPHIINQMKDLLPHLFENKTLGANFLMRGPSGWGKTRMSFMICNYLSGGDFDYCLADKISFNQNRRVHFIDEIHLIEHPETLYPFMDSGKYIIVLATNDVALLPEALSNRCDEFIFDRYSLPDLRSIAGMYLAKPLPTQFTDYIIESGGGNPRIIKQLIGRLNIILSRRPEAILGITLEQFRELLRSTFGIEDGMDILCNRYLNGLRSLGGTAALATLSTFIHVDQNTLKFYAEPVLLYKNRIKITSKGRSLI
jgi:Holliday junction resolvasome RuvABC ATP-dependent DNA helicase subunit